MVRQAFMIFLTALVVLAVVIVAFKVLAGLAMLIVIGVGVGIGAVLTFVFIYKINQLWRNFRNKPEPGSPKKWRE